MNTTPAWFYGPNGQAKIFDDLKDVPNGWQDHPSKVEGISAPAPKLEKPVVAPVAAPLADAVDADGHKFDPTMHTGTMTKAGLWRMKVGVCRPAPLTKPLDL